MRCEQASLLLISSQRISPVSAPPIRPHNTTHTTQPKTQQEKLYYEYDKFEQPLSCPQCRKPFEKVRAEIDSLSAR